MTFTNSAINSKYVKLCTWNAVRINFSITFSLPSDLSVAAGCDVAEQQQDPPLLW